VSIDNDAPIDELPELEFHEVTTSDGPSARAVIAIAAVCGLALLYGTFNAVTGNLGMVTLLVVLLGIVGLVVAYKKMDAAEGGELKELRDKLLTRSGPVPEPSVRISGSLLDI